VASGKRRFLEIESALNASRGSNCERAVVRIVGKRSPFHPSTVNHVGPKSFLVGTFFDGNKI